MEKLKSIRQRYPLIVNALMIAVIIFIMAIVAHFVMQIGTRHGSRRTVPDFAGMPLKEAIRTARDCDLELRINDSLYVPAYEGGIILDQLPEKGVEVKPGRKVYITINSFRQKMVPVPYVAGRSLRQAKNMLEIAGLEIKELIYRPDMATNYVLEQELNGKPVTASSRFESEMGSGVTLYVGAESDSRYTVTPQLVGQSLRAAKSRLWESGLNIGAVVYDEGINLLNQKDARVYIQNPSAERGTTLGAKVDLTLTLDMTKLTSHRSAAIKQADADAKARHKADSVSKVKADSVAAAAKLAATPAPAAAAEQKTEFFD